MVPLPKPDWATLQTGGLGSLEVDDCTGQLADVVKHAAPAQPVEVESIPGGVMFTTNCAMSLWVVGPAVPEAEFDATQLLSPTV
jgi:hypothetical protein